MKFDNNIEKYREEIIKHQTSKYSMQEDKSGLPVLNESTEIILKESINNLIENGKGTVLLEGDKISGYMIGYEIEEMWGSSSIHIPLYGHGIIYGNINKSYQKLYKEISQSWINKGYNQHAITVYAEEDNVVNTWFWLGFGLRCVDGIKDVSMNTEPNGNIIKINDDNIYKLKDLHTEHTKYYSKPPLFMIRNEDENPLETLKKWHSNENNHLFAYFEKGRVVGYMRIEEKGEQFLTADSKMMNITSAYVDPAYRGNNIGLKLLNHIENWLADRDYKKLGVDFESFNTLGSNFWKKFFNMYSYTMVRRIDG